MRIFAMALVAIAGLGISCSSDPTDPATNVTIESEITNRNISAVQKSGDRTLGMPEVSNITVTSVRVLVSRIILHTNGSSETEGNNTFKLEPMVYVADALAPRVIASAKLPAGSYDKIKWEVHRFSSSEAPSYADNITFKDFVTGDRYTAIIEGTLVRNGSTELFTYRSDATANVTINFSPAVTVDNSSTLFMTLQFDASSVFKDGTALLDPMNPSNMSKIDNRIKDAFRANKRI